MDLALNNLQRLICHKTKQTKPKQTKPDKKNFLNENRNKKKIIIFSLTIKVAQSAEAVEYTICISAKG